MITRSPDDPADINVGIYRMQVLDRDRLIVRWLAQRGGARHHTLWKRKGLDTPIAVVIGADPATILSAVMPLPDGMSELSFSGVLRGERLKVGTGLTVDLPIPASAEIVIEGHISPDDVAEEGPYGDHTGYYNSVERFPVMRVSAITSRTSPIYLSTFTGRPPDEPSVLGEAMTELFLPIVRRQFPEIRDLHLPPEACSYRAMVVSIDKRYPGQARRVMMGLWSALPQFTYTKLIMSWIPTSTFGIGTMSSGPCRPGSMHRATRWWSTTLPSTTWTLPRPNRGWEASWASTQPTNWAKKPAANGESRSP